LLVVEDNVEPPLYCSHVYDKGLGSVNPENFFGPNDATMKLTLVVGSATPMNIVKWQKPAPAPDVDALMLAYWLMYCRTPRKETPEVDGSYSLGEIGADTGKKWVRWSP
jgi:hypothetical protein